MSTTEVLIVGAGPTGLTMANLLARSGVEFRIIDKVDGTVEESRALVIHAKILELLDKLGLADRAVAGGQKMGAAELLREGKSVGKLSFFEDGREDRTPYPMALIYEQHRTERLLIQGLEEAGGGIEWNTELLDLSQTSEGTRATIRRSDGSEETIEAGWVVGADGASSPVRHSLELGFEGDTYEQTLFLADLEMDWERGDQRVYVDFAPASFYGLFPMPGDRRFRLIGSVTEDLEGREEITVEDVQQTLDEHSGLRTRITALNWSSIYRTHRRMTERFRVGRVFLAGDAAHIHSPAGGQGMNTGIGDAYNLGWKLASVVKGHARESLLDSYEAERMPFARAILSGSDRGFSLVGDTTNPASRQLRTFVAPLLFRGVSHVPPLRRWGFWLVSQLWTSYRESPAVEESGPLKRGPRAGDRAPYGFFEDGPHAHKSIFELLRGPDHHLLIFEGKQPNSRRLDAAREEIEALLQRYEMPASIHQISTGNRKLHKSYGASESRLFLVRPDGHVAYSGAASDLVGLRMYLDRLFVRSRNESAGAKAFGRSARV
ncbi:MAG: FAD-dependent monooxygenase [Rubrobacteraceae bacterium]